MRVVLHAPHDDKRRHCVFPVQNNFPNRDKLCLVWFQISWDAALAVNINESTHQKVTYRMAWSGVFFTLLVQQKRKNIISYHLLRKGLPSVYNWLKGEGPAYPCIERVFFSRDRGNISAQPSIRSSFSNRPPAGRHENCSYTVHKCRAASAAVILGPNKSWQTCP